MTELEKSVCADRESVACNGCKYRTGRTDYGCDYIGQTGRSRLKAIREIEDRTGKRPERCPVREDRRKAAAPRAAWEKPEKAAGPDPVDVDAVRKMAARGLSDKKIGDALGVTRNVILNVRKRNQIPAGVPSKGGWTSRACISG